MPAFFEDFSVWMQGVLFILIVYQISAYFFTKDKSFAIYAGYLCLLFLYLIPKSRSESSYYLEEEFYSFFAATNWIVQVFFWLFYTWFGIHFLNIDEKNKKLATHLRQYIIITFIVSSIFFLVDFFFFEGIYMSVFFMFIYTPTSLIVIGFFLPVIYKFKDQLNKFFVIGLLFFLSFSVISLIVSSFEGGLVFGLFRPIDIFIFGVLCEAITLSIGLSYKYFLFRKERDAVNKLLNAQLTKQVAEKMAELELISKQAEKDKIKILKSNFDNQISELKLASLHSQMNPHFIFNALNSIKLYIINSEQKKAAYYLTKFSKLIRKILEATSKTEISLEEELETMDLYANIENIRFSNEIAFQIFTNSKINISQIKVPPLILQPFIENAIWHGLSSKKSDKKITIKIEKFSDDFIQIEIQDNGIGRIASAEIKANKKIQRKSVGVNLSKERLENFTKNKINKFNLIFVDLKDDNECSLGTKVVLEIPLT